MYFLKRQVNPGPERGRSTHQDTGLHRTAHPCQPRLPMHGDRLQRLHPLQGGPTGYEPELTHF